MFPSNIAVYPASYLDSPVFMSLSWGLALFCSVTAAPRISTGTASFDIFRDSLFTNKPELPKRQVKINIGLKRNDTRVPSGSCQFSSCQFKITTTIITLSNNNNNNNNYYYIIIWRHAVAQLVEALRYKPEGCGFDSRWCHWNFSLT